MFKLFESKTSALSMATAKEELERNPDIALIDVRSRQEYREGHIPGSINVPLDSAGNIEKVVPDKNTKVFVYCLSGGRSKSACSLFGRLGYTDVTNIGGISAWTGKIKRGETA